MVLTPDSARADLKDAMKEYSVGHFDTAHKLLLALDKSLPSDATQFSCQLLHNQGECLRQQAVHNRSQTLLEDAAEKFHDALKLRDPEQLWHINSTRCCLAQVLIQMGNTRKAENILNQAKEQLKTWRVEMTFAELREVDSFDEAKEHVQKALDLAVSEPDHITCLLDATRFYLRHELPGAEPLLKEALEIARDPQEVAEVKEEWARLHAKEANYTKAYKLFKEVLSIRREKCKKHPKHIACLQEFVRMCIDSKDFTDAEKGIHEWKKISPSVNSKAAAINTEAAMWETRKDYVKATNVYMEANNMAVTDMVVRANTNMGLGALMRMKKDYENAEQYLGNAKEALENCHYQSIDVRYARSKVAYEMGVLWSMTDKVPEAMEHFQNAKRLRLDVGPPNETHYPALKQIGFLYSKMDAAQAEDVYLEAKSAAKKNGYLAAAAAFDLGLFYQTRGKYEKAIKELLESKRLAEKVDDMHEDSKNLQVYQIRTCEALAQIYKKLGKNKLAWDSVLEGIGIARLCALKVLEGTIRSLERMLMDMKEVKHKTDESAWKMKKSEEITQKMLALFKQEPKGTGLKTENCLAVFHSDEREGRTFTDVNEIWKTAMLNIAIFDKKTQIWTLKEPKNSEPTFV